MRDKVSNLLSVAAKAGKIKSGEVAVEAAIKSQKAHLVIVAADASDNTKKNFRNMCKYHDISYAEYSDKESVARCIGKDYRSSLAVLDEGFARAINKLLIK